MKQQVEIALSPRENMATHTLNRKQIAIKYTHTVHAEINIDGMAGCAIYTLMINVFRAENRIAF